MSGVGNLGALKSGARFERRRLSTNDRARERYQLKRELKPVFPTPKGGIAHYVGRSLVSLWWHAAFHLGVDGLSVQGMRQSRVSHAARRKVAAGPLG